MASTSTTPPTPEGWRTTIDGWIRDPAIRKFGLTSLGMLLVGVAIAVGFATGAILALLNVLLPSLMTKALAGGVISTTCGGIWFLRRRAHQRSRSTSSEPGVPG